MAWGLDNLFTAPGTNARDGQVRGQRDASRHIEDLYAALLGGQGGGTALGNQIRLDDAAVRQALMQWVQSLQAQGNPQALGGLYEASANQALRSRAHRQAGAARGAGITDQGTLAALAGGDALTGARVRAGARNQGRNQAVQNQGQAVSALGGLSAQNNNTLNLLGALNGMIQNQAPIQVGAGPLDYLAQVAGMAVQSQTGRPRGGGGNSSTLKESPWSGVWGERR